MNINEIITPALVSGIISTLLGGAAYIAIKSRFDRELESAKKDLLIEAKRDEIRFSELRKQQAEVFKVYYSNLVKTYGKAVTLTSLINNPVESIDLNYTEFYKTANIFFEYYNGSRIFLTQKICDLTEDFAGKVRLAADMFTTIKEERGMDRSTRWHECWDMVTVDCKEIMSEVEKQFRNLLGVESEN